MLLYEHLPASLEQLEASLRALPQASLEQLFVGGCCCTGTHATHAHVRGACCCCCCVSPNPNMKHLLMPPPFLAAPCIAPAFHHHPTTTSRCSPTPLLPAMPDTPTPSALLQVNGTIFWLVLRVGFPVASTLQGAMARGHRLTHCNLQPSNVVLSGATRQGNAPSMADAMAAQLAAAGAAGSLEPSLLRPFVFDMAAAQVQLQRCEWEAQGRGELAPVPEARPRPAFIERRGNMGALAT